MVSIIVKGMWSFLLFVLISLCIHVQAHTPPTEKGLYKFIENKGQWQKEVIFKATVPGGALFLEKGGMTYNFFDNSVLSNLHSGRIKPENAVYKYHSLKISFVNADLDGVKTSSESPTEE